MGSPAEAGASEGSKLPSNFPYIRAWVVTALSIILYMVAAIPTAPVISQYVVSRLRESVFNSSDVNTTRRVCGEHGNLTADDRLDQEVQKHAASLNLYYSLVGSLSAIVINIFIGPLSDSIGRRFMFISPLLGILTKNVIITFIVYFKLDTNYFYLANLIDGLSGSYFAMLVAIFAYTADITVPGKPRTIAMAVMEGCLPVAASIGLLSTGFLIKSTGFFYPMVLFVTLGALDLVVVFFLLPETRVTKTLDRSPLKSLKKVFGFYFTEDTVQKRIFYAIAMGIFFFSVVTVLGRSALETIYQLGKPFCWDSVKIGYFGALRTTSMVIFSVTVIKILHRCLQEEVIGIISCLSAIAGFLLQGVANTSLLMYLAPIAGVVSGATTPIARSIMSRMTSPSQQGALFASIAVVEAVCHSTSNLLYNAVYNATVDYYKGIVWFFMAGMALVDLLLLLIFRLMPRKGTGITLGLELVTKL